MAEHMKYWKIPKLGSSETVGILEGCIEVYPKLDGTNASVWYEDGTVCAGSRNRVLAIGDDNAGFLSWFLQQYTLISFVEDYPNLRIFGEWLVPHTIKGYLDLAWKNFYVFDVYDKSIGEFIPYDVYAPLLSAGGFSVIKPVFLESPTAADIERLAPEIAAYLMKPDMVGEGVVIKNRAFINRYGNGASAKYVLEHFNNRVQDITPVINVEHEIAQALVTPELVEQTAAKILNSSGKSDWDRARMIPMLIKSVQRDVYAEDLYDKVVEMKGPLINHKVFHGAICSTMKKVSPQYF